MNSLLLSILAQVPIDQLDRSAPALRDEASTGVTWMIITAIVLGILAISFKNSRRSHLE